MCLLSDGERLTGAYALGPEAAEWLQQATLAIRARVPLDVARNVLEQRRRLGEPSVEWNATAPVARRQCGSGPRAVSARRRRSASWRAIVARISAAIRRDLSGSSVPADRGRARKERKPTSSDRSVTGSSGPPQPGHRSRR